PRKTYSSFSGGEVQSKCLSRRRSTAVRRACRSKASQLFFFGGTLPPFLRDFENPMAMACLPLFAFPFFPLRCFPRLVLCMAFFTSRLAVEPYFAIRHLLSKLVFVGAPFCPSDSHFRARPRSSSKFAVSKRVPTYFEMQMARQMPADARQ